MKKIALALSLLLLPGVTFAENNALELMGLMSGQNLYMSYAATGFLFDSAQGNIYEKNFTLRMSRELGASIKKTRLAMEKFIETEELAEEDLTAAKAILDAYEALNSVVNALYAACENPSTETRRQYERQRARAWNKIADILNIETE